MGIIRYIPQKKTPVIIFTEERLDVKSLHISKEHYLDRKREYVDRLGTLMEYASHRNRCRNLFLLAYFGEKGGNKCGQCDVCMQDQELDVNKYEYDRAVEQARTLLREKPLSLDELVMELALPPEKSIIVIRWLLDHNKILKGLDERLSWNK